MGNHLHALIEEADPEADTAWLERALRRMPDWPPVEVGATVAEGRLKVLRDLRYIALNPCRARLARDPLAWLWSTHRELFDAVADPWIDRTALAELSPSFEDLHTYVSGDPHVTVAGTQPPDHLVPTDIARQPLGDIARAAIVATRGGELQRRSTTRHLFLCLAPERGWRDVPELAGVCGVSRQAVYQAWRRPVDLTPALRCLGDARLLAALTP